LTLDEFEKKHGIRWEHPHSCILPIFTNGEDIIYWIDPDGFRKSWFFITVNNEGEVINEKISPSEFYKNIDFLLNDGWYNSKGITDFLGKDIKTWVYDFATQNGISL